MDVKYPIPYQSQLAGPANVRAKVTHEDLTEETADTDQTLTLLTVPAGMAFRFVSHELLEAFEDASDNALNDTKISIGVSGATTRFLEAIQVNENGTEVVKSMGKQIPGSLTAATVTTPDGSDAGTTQTLANALKAEVNKVVADLETLKAGPYYVFAADTDIIMTVESMSGKKLSDIDTGDLLVWFDMR